LFIKILGSNGLPIKSKKSKKFDWDWPLIIPRLKASLTDKYKFSSFSIGLDNSIFSTLLT
jgi:hypothetical protein